MDAATKPPPPEARKGVGDDLRAAPIVELAIRVGTLGLLIYLALALVQPFITVVIWSVVIAVALHPAYERLAPWLGGRRRLAAALLTIASLLVIIGPVFWLALGLIDSLRTISERLDLSALSLPPPPHTPSRPPSDWTSYMTKPQREPPMPTAMLLPRLIPTPSVLLLQTKR